MIMQHFRNYDLDKNGNIDGLEILKAANRMNGEAQRGLSFDALAANLEKMPSTFLWLDKIKWG